MIPASLLPDVAPAPSANNFVSATPSRITQLAISIQENTARLEQYISSKALPPLSFDNDFPVLPAELEECRTAVLVATDELTDLMLGPRQMAEMFPPIHTSMISTQAISRFGIARAFGKDEEVSFEELSRRCDLAVDDTTRLLRHAMSRHVFKEPRRGFVAHNAASRTLVDEPLIDDYIASAADDMWLAAANCVNAMERWRKSPEPSHTGFSFATGSKLSFFDALKADEKLRQNFTNTMTYMSTRKGLGADDGMLSASFNWDGSTIVDVGGGQGSAAMEILRSVESPETRFIVQDLPDVIASASESIPSDLSDKLQFMAHDFFEIQTVKNADVFLFRRILHDWSDEKAINILRNLIPVLKKGAHIVLLEHIISEPGNLPFYFEKIVRNMDMAMKSTFNSRERDVTDWQSLFERADGRFDFVETKLPSTDLLGVMIWRWQG